MLQQLSPTLGQSSTSFKVLHQLSHRLGQSSANHKVLHQLGPKLGQSSTSQSISKELHQMSPFLSAVLRILTAFHFLLKSKPLLHLLLKSQLLLHLLLKSQPLLHLLPKSQPLLHLLKLQPLLHPVDQLRRLSRKKLLPSLLYCQSPSRCQSLSLSEGLPPDRCRA